jgi:shikimate dehydrogenase
VNTIVNRGGKLTGYNTDWNGALEALEEKVNLKAKKIVLLGAGGAARAVGFGLKERDCQLIVVNRSKKKGERLSRELGCDYLPKSSLVRMKAGELEAEVIINATSLGMVPRDGETPFPKYLLKKGMVVMDIVYQPLQTKLLREAKERGCLTVNGLEMLMRQGAAQFEIWTGRRLEIGEIKKDLLRTLKGKPIKTRSAGLKKGEQ